MPECRSEPMLPTDITWIICDQARPTASALKAELGDERYEAVRVGLREFICGYFSAVGACDAKLGNSISPIKSDIRQGKGLKVRFGYPGCGKSGGLRLAVLAFCDQRMVKIAGAWIRREDPDDDDLTEAFDAS